MQYFYWKKKYKKIPKLVNALIIIEKQLMNATELNLKS